MLGQQRVADVADLSLARTSWTSPRKVPPLSWMVSMLLEQASWCPWRCAISMPCTLLT
jgi:hypothetical protein